VFFCGLIMWKHDEPWDDCTNSLSILSHILGKPESVSLLCTQYCQDHIYLLHTDTL
jgi:hypothetical protein